MKRRGLVLIALVLAVTLAWGTLALGAYPERPIKLIIPWAAGGDTDAIVRIFAEVAKKYFPQPLVATNITGASGTRGALEARKSPPDGYTLYSVHDSIHTTYYTGVSDVNYSDFEPICLATSTWSMLVASAKSPWKSMKELLDDAKKRPGEIKMGATLGSTSHFFPAMIEKEAGVKFKYVSYEGTAQRMTVLLGEHVELGETNLTQLPAIKGGKLKLLAMATEKRSPEAPDVPTLKELGINVVYAVNRGYLVPKGTPEAIQVQLEQTCEKVSKDPAFTDKMKPMGTDVVFLGRNAYGDFLKKNDGLNAEVAQALGIKKR